MCDKNSALWSLVNCSDPTCRSDLALKARTEVSHVEERKNDQIDHIKKSHEKAFNEIKNYYNDITLNNLAMIATLKEEIKDRELKIERSEKQVESKNQLRNGDILVTLSCYFTLRRLGLYKLRTRG
jgi:hypothetical protein